ncbi:hypothetical protein amrb99_63240 [Actinomadura sp. RB99]|nr:hypothetical protein [Actinomadura sp. RB99]
MRRRGGRVDDAALMHELGLNAAAASWMGLLGNPAGARECYARVVELAARLQLPAPPPFDEFVRRDHSARDWPLDVWRDKCGL